MEVPSPGPSEDRLRKPLKVLVALAFADLAAFVILAYVHVLTSDGALVSLAEALGDALALLAGITLLFGAVHVWLAYPKHRRPIAFVVAITLVTLMAHAYVIGSPPAADQRTPVSGVVGAQLESADKDGAGNHLVTLFSTTSGSQLMVTVQASGSEAIAGLGLTADVGLNGTGFGGVGTFRTPLQQGTSTTGTWAASGTVRRITLSYQSLDCYSTASQEYGCIMDEVFYVPEGMGILAGQHCSTGAGAPSDCHLEHPPLVPALLAAGMAAFGAYNAVGWRVMPALLGTFSIPLLFGIAWKVSGSKKLAYLSATLLSLDVMFFSQSSGGLLDIPEVFFGLAAFFVYFAGLRVWKFDRYVLAGVFLGLAGLAKETAVFIVLAFVTYVLFFGEGNRWVRGYQIFKVAVVVVLVFAGGLQVYDSTLTTSQYHYFYQHVNYILNYGSGLVANYLECQGGPHSVGYWCKYPNDPGGPPILPTDWLVYYSPILYFAVSVCPNSVNGVCQGGSYEAIAYYGVTNLLETWTVYIWGPLVAYTLYRWYRRPRSSPHLPTINAPVQPEMLEAQPSRVTGEVRFSGLALTLFLWNYVPYIFLLLAGRVTYPFYIIPAIPAMVMGAGFWLSRDWFPRWLMYVYLVMVFFFFFVYFPDKAFLPVWLRSLIGH